MLSSWSQLVYNAPMNYISIYNQLVLRAKQRPRPSGYVERHHIIPLAWDGPDTEENIVAFTGREHFIAHLLLARAYPKSSMVHAAWKMACVNDAKYRVTSRTYELLRRRHAERVGPIASEANKKKLECPHCGKVGGIAIMRRWHFDYCPNGPLGLKRPSFKRMSPTPETRAKIGAKASGRPSVMKGKKADSLSQREGFEKMRQTRIANGTYRTLEERALEEAQKLIKTSTCPWCGKTGGKSIMKR